MGTIPCEPFIYPALNSLITFTYQMKEFYRFVYH